MDVKIFVPHNINMEKIENEYPDLITDDIDADGSDVYFVGDPENPEWFDRETAEICCGFVEGAIPGADTLIDGCGEWAMQQVRRGENYRKGYELGSL